MVSRTLVNWAKSVRRFMPFFSAFEAAACMVGPSAKGSLKGMPISTISMPPCCNASRVGMVLSSVGLPAQKYTERMFSRFSAKSCEILDIERMCKCVNVKMCRLE